MGISSCTFNPNPRVSPLNAIYTSFGYGLDTSSHFADTLLLSYDTIRHIGDHYAWWNAGGDVVTVEEAHQNYLYGKFKRWRARRFALVNDIDAQQYWFYTIVKNSHRDHIVANVTGNADIGSIVGYRLSTDNNWVMTDSVSPHTPLGKKIHHSQNYVDTFTLAPNEARTFMFKIDKTTSLTIQAHFVINPFSFSHYLNSRNIEIQQYFFIGLICFMLILTMLLFLVTGEKIFLYQSSYIFFSLWVIATKSSYDDKWLPDFLFVPQSYLPQYCLTLIACAFITPIFIEFIQPHKFSSKISRLLKWVMRINIAVIVLSLVQFGLTFLLDKEMFRLVNFWLTLPSLAFLAVYFWVILFVAIYSLRHVSPKLKIYASAIAVAMVMWYIQVLNQVGITNSTFALHNNIFLTLIIEVCVYTYFIIDSYVSDKRDKLQLYKSQLDLQQKLTSSIVEAQENERKRIAQELHDGLGGFLSALRMMVNKKRNLFLENDDKVAAETLTEVQQKLDAAIKDVREISHDLMPSDFEKKDFSEILKEHIVYLNENDKLLLDYFIDERINQYDKILLISIYRITLELIRNIQKHAEATKATIQLIVHPNEMILQVEDNGKGFNLQANKGIGLDSIRSRVKYHNGTVNVDSGKLGTTFVIEIPTKNED